MTVPPGTPSSVTDQDWEPLEESPDVAAAVRDDTTVPELTTDDAADEGPEFVEPADPADTDSA